MKQQIYPCLWFNQQAKEAAEFYCVVFGAEITDENHFVSTFEAAGQKFMCLNGGPEFTPNPSISFYVTCESETEVENAWAKLSDGGKALMPLDKYPWSPKYGWIQDKYGVSWQLAFGKMEDVGQKFSPTLMFTGEKAGKAKEAIGYYTSIFKNSSVTGIMKYGAGEGDIEGHVKHAQFSIDGYVMMTMDSSQPHGFGFNEGISLVVECETQEEIDYYWKKMSAVPEAEQCGWLKDKYGISWQIVPAMLQKLINDPEKGQAVVQAFMQMKKFEIDKLLAAAEGN
ncbi:Glyoxalase superfamily enzyme, possibly 3-demethylubiquinone-9 3-methyltransferase [Tangfeifania diversioriginum]|uniref:Glyoxalase superfamily enzyme, possibly 3-demethylubiquinone-9 3-methyltransferase n=1 Tax=Tangfeifania diversioriginum TaxID=1168035 RepID=A0A1M6JFN0_9BACT|nr:VOC family protein [Tangfeifania diversioriginum]SHJ45460.1 Glyoxalase superfamily enzyme, possibly 3-demethylubiquinone-9 3-methyltransferase [Tangfeifania diversioriginum]